MTERWPYIVPAALFFFGLIGLFFLGRIIAGIIRDWPWRTGRKNMDIAFNALPDEDCTGYGLMSLLGTGARPGDVSALSAAFAVAQLKKDSTGAYTAVQSS